MKKIIIVFLVFLFLVPFSVNARPKVASDWIKDDIINDQTHMPVCSYRYTFEYVAPMTAAKSTEFLRINIYYRLNDSKWRVFFESKEDLKSKLMSYNSATGVNNINSIKYYDKTGGFNRVFANKFLHSIKIKIDDGAKENLKNGICPEGAWIVKSGSLLKSFNTICFGSKSYCKPDKTEGSEKNYDFVDEIDKYFANYSPNINSCDDFRKLNFNVNDRLEKDFEKNFLHGRTLPGFIANNEHYKTGLVKIQTVYNNYKNDCDKEVENNSNLTEKEKEALLKQNQEALDNALHQLSEYKESIQGLFILPEAKEIDCNSIFSGNFGLLLKQVLSMIRFVAPILIIGLSIVDFIKAIAAQNDTELKKAANRLVKRLVIGVIIFLLPTLLEVILKMAGIEYGTCGIK